MLGDRFEDRSVLARPPVVGAVAEAVVVHEQARAAPDLEHPAQHAADHAEPLAPAQAQVALVEARVHHRERDHHEIERAAPFVVPGAVGMCGTGAETGLLGEAERRVRAKPGRIEPRPVAHGQVAQVVEAMVDHLAPQAFLEPPALDVEARATLVGHRVAAVQPDEAFAIRGDRRPGPAGAALMQVAVAVFRCLAPDEQVARRLGTAAALERDDPVEVVPRITPRHDTPGDLPEAPGGSEQSTASHLVAHAAQRTTAPAARPANRQVDVVGGHDAVRGLTVGKRHAPALEPRGQLRGQVVDRRRERVATT